MTGVVRVFDPYKYRSLLYKDGMPDQEFSNLCLRQLEETILYENPEAIGKFILYCHIVIKNNSLSCDIHMISAQVINNEFSSKFIVRCVKIGSITTIRYFSFIYFYKLSCVKIIIKYIVTL
jgi:hypothetical protein